MKFDATANKPILLAMKHLNSIDDPVRVLDGRGNPYLQYTEQHVKAAFIAGHAAALLVPVLTEEMSDDQTCEHCDDTGIIDQPSTMRPQDRFCECPCGADAWIEENLRSALCAAALAQDRGR